MRQLIHNGVLIPKSREPLGLSVLYRGEKIPLSGDQEEMAIAWVKKLDTAYVKDKRFVSNFFRDFKEALGIRGRANPRDFDFSEVASLVEEERKRKLSLSREERKRLAEARRAVREADKEKYGYAVVDGVRVEITNYVVEPPSIFMGRGRHPLRGRWKPRIYEHDVTLNLSPDALVPPGNWGKIVWEPECMWIAKWRDKLRRKMKHVWFSDASYIKQRREMEKFDKAWELEQGIGEVRRHIEANLTSGDPWRRKTATVCYLIDHLRLRVGDEKGEDEADTVGATTLTPEHIIFKEGGETIFTFLGKDSVKWRRSAVLPEVVIKNLEEFMSSSESSIFSGIMSSDVSSFLDEVMPGLTAKVFRTYHATKRVKNFLERAKVSKSSPDYIKAYVAKMANLEAAIDCNHKKKPPKGWKESLEKKRKRLEELMAKKRTKSVRERIRRLRLQYRLMKRTKTYNLGTSLKSYIDPRIYKKWADGIDYDWKLYYPKALRRKFSWIDLDEA
jgi:DNA topoisomerase-1